MFNNFGLIGANLFKKAEAERFALHHPYVGTEHLLLAILATDKEMSAFLKEYNLTYDNFKKELIMVVGNATKGSEINLYTPMLKRVINNALENAKENNNGVVTARHLILSILEEGEGIAIRLLISMNIDIDSIYDNLSKNNKLVNKKLEIYQTGTILNDIVSLDEAVVGRDREIDLIIETLLRKKKNNPLLIGDAGVGKTAIVEELVRRIKRKEVPDSLFDAKVVSLEMGSLVSGTKYRGEFEEKLTKIIRELESEEKIILFIDEIHAMVSAGGAEGAITAGDIFKPALARGKIKVIGATTCEEYNKFFSNDKALMRRFEVINITEPKDKEVKNILNKVKSEYEHHHHVIIPDNILDLIVLYTDRFIKNKKNPDKAIDFLDSVCSKVKNESNNNEEKKKLYNRIEELKLQKNEYVKNNDYEKALSTYSEELAINKKLKNYNRNKKLVVREKDVIKVLENKTGMIFTKENLNIFDDMENEINNSLYNVSKYTKRITNLIKDNLINKKGFLKIYLEGPEGLGKSSIVKKYATMMPNANFIRIDLKEYKSLYDINKLLGTTQGYVGYNDEHLFTKVKNNNFNMILFDNYSECHPNIKDLIKEILKEGYITDNKGDKIYFNNSFIFLTDDTIPNNKIGFVNSSNNKNYNEIEDLVDEVIKFESLKEEDLINYLQSKGVYNISEIIKKSNYEKVNYKNLDKLIKDDKLLKTTN